MRLLVTGGLGFIGSNFILTMLKSYKDLSIINLDLITYAGNFENLKDVENYGDRYQFIRGDITDRNLVGEIGSMKPDVIINFAAESHVDRSILDSSQFLKTNIIGTQVLLDCCREHKIDRFVQISTDEVYGSLGPSDPPFTENNNLKPNSPYSASKASADMLARAYHKTYWHGCCHHKMFK